MKISKYLIIALLLAGALSACTHNGPARPVGGDLNININEGAGGINPGQAVGGPPPAPPPAEPGGDQAAGIRPPFRQLYKHKIFVFDNQDAPMLANKYTWQDDGKIKSIVFENFGGNSKIEVAYNGNTATAVRSQVNVIGEAQQTSTETWFFDEQGRRTKIISSKRTEIRDMNLPNGPQHVRVEFIPSISVDYTYFNDTNLVQSFTAKDLTPAPLPPVEMYTYTYTRNLDKPEQIDQITLDDKRAPGAAGKKADYIETFTYEEGYLKKMEKVLQIDGEAAQPRITTNCVYDVISAPTNITCTSDEAPNPTIQTVTLERNADNLVSLMRIDKTADGRLSSVTQTFEYIDSAVESVGSSFPDDPNGLFMDLESYLKGSVGHDTGSMIRGPE